MCHSVKETILPTLIQITQTKCDHEPVGRQGINLILNFLKSMPQTLGKKSRAPF